MDRINFLGDYYHFQISPNSQLVIGHNVQLRSFVSLEVNDGARLVMGDNAYINDHSTIRCFHAITIGANTMMGDGVRIYDFDHTFTDYHIGRISSTKAPVSIGKNCWIGANCVITKGVTIGDNVIVGAGTVVTKDIPSNSLVYRRGGGLIIKPRHQATYHAFVLTYSAHIEHLRYLLEGLPEVDFHIAAPTMVSPDLQALGQEFTNCQIYPLVYHDYSVETLIAQCDVYLDINHGGEVDGVLDKVLLAQKPILAFDQMAHRPDLEQVTLVPLTQPEKMVEHIKKIIGID